MGSNLFLLLLAFNIQSTVARQFSDFSDENTIPRTFDGAPQGRIVNGVESKLFSRPYQASLQYNLGAGWRHFCGAVIIADNRLLSAGHCLGVLPVEYIRVEVGSIDLAAPPLKYTQFLEVHSVRIHENFTQTDDWSHNDVGIVYLKKKMIFNRNVQPAKIAPPGLTFDHQKCVASGWGSLSFMGALPSTLHETKMIKLTDEECRAVHDSFAFPYVPNLICVKGELDANGNPTGVCSGDSGGPLLCGQKRKYLAGTTSYGFVNCDKTWPDVYTNSAGFNSWIRKHKHPDNVSTL